MLYKQINHRNKLTKTLWKKTKQIFAVLFLHVSSTASVHILIGSKWYVPKIKTLLSKNTPNLKCYKIHCLSRLYSFFLLLWACVSSVCILMVTRWHSVYLDQRCVVSIG